MTGPVKLVSKLTIWTRNALSESSRAGYIALGCLFLLLGFIGALLPLMPTTVFLIAAAWAFSRSSPRLEAWLLTHRRFGPTLVAWRTNGAMSRRAKIAACTGKTIGYALFLALAKPPAWLALTVLAVMASVAVWIIRRPAPSTCGPRHLPILAPETPFQKRTVGSVPIGGLPCD